MPQTRTVDWQHIPAEQHIEYLHTLGNLSITGYNAELSNRSFAEKQAMLRAKSKANQLNKDVWDKEQWTIEDIQSRAKRLSEILVARYTLGNTVDESIELKTKAILHFDDYKLVTGNKLLSFTFLGNTYMQSTFAGMLHDMLKLLEQKEPTRFLQLAQKKFLINRNTSKAQLHPLLDIRDTQMRKPAKVKEGIYYETNLSAEYCIRFIEALFKELHLNREDFSFEILVKSPKSKATKG